MMRFLLITLSVIGVLQPTILIANPGTKTSFPAPKHHGEKKAKALRRIIKAIRKPLVLKRNLRYLSLVPKTIPKKTQTATLPPRFDAKFPIKTLPQLYQLVKKNNLNLKVLQKQVALAKLASSKAWSILKPQLSLLGSYTRNDNEVKLGDSVLTPRDQLVVQFQAQWAFFNLQAIPLLQTAHLAVQKVKHTVKQIKQELLYATARAYYGVLLTDGFVDIARRTLLNSKEHLRIAIARFKGGVVPQLVITKAKLDVAKARRQWLQAQNALRNAMLALALLLNRPQFQFRAQRPPPFQPPSGSLASWRKLAIQNQSGIKASQTAVQIAKKQLTTQWMKFLPTMAAVANIQGINATGFSGRNFAWSISVVMQLNIYQGGIRYVQVQEARNKLFQANLKRAIALRNVDNKLSKAILTLKDNKATLQVAKEQKKLATESYNLTQNRFKTGLATPIEVSDALTALQGAELVELQNKLNYDLALLNLQRALGLFNP